MFCHARRGLPSFYAILSLFLSACNPQWCADKVTHREVIPVCGKPNTIEPWEKCRATDVTTSYEKKRYCNPQNVCATKSNNK